MNRRFRHFHFPLIAAAALLMIGLGLRSSTRADFEVPIKDPLSAIPGDLNAVWGSYHGQQFTGGGGTIPSSLPSLIEEHYEIWGVGKAQTGGSGLIYEYDGSRWSSLTPKYLQANTDTVAYAGAIKSFLAVAGQNDNNTGITIMWFVGENGQSFFKRNFLASGGYGSENFNASVFKDSGNNVITPNDDLYAVGAIQQGNSTAAMGGEHGQYFEHVQYDGNFPGLDIWKQSSVAVPWTNQDAVTGIAFGKNGNAYVTTTHFQTSKIDRTCGGAPTSQLWVRDYAGGTGWHALGGAHAGCFYGVSVDGLNDHQSNNGPLLSAVWIAANDGIWRFEESNTVAFSGTMSHDTASAIPIFGVTSAVSRQGEVGANANLLYNGDLESWTHATPSGNNVNPNGWSVTGEYLGTHNDSGDPTKCYTNNLDIRLDVGHTAGSKAILVEPGPYYSSVPLQPKCLASLKCDSGALINQICATDDDCRGSQCVNGGPLGATTRTDNTMAVSQRIDLTNIPATKFQVSGWYKVEFTGAASAKFPQAGVATHCSGTNNWNGAIRGSSDCSLSDLHFMRTQAQGPTGGWVPFSFTISRQDDAFDYVVGETTSYRPSPRTLNLEVWCEATYGARVWCDDMKVTPVNEPPLTFSEQHQVWAVGAITGVGLPSLSLYNADARTNPANYVAEPVAPTGGSLRSVMAVDPAHVYTVGESSAIFQRSQGNISGYVWAGTSQGNGIGSGWISANCLNDVDSGGVNLCQRVAQPYGLNLDTTNNILGGRAWFGKTYNTDREAINVGPCLKPSSVNVPFSTAQAGQPYGVAGQCDLTKRTCKDDVNKACNHDFDCYYRCAKDEGFLCLTNADCQYGTDNPLTAGVPSPLSGTRLKALPADRLRCGTDSGTALACRPVGYLSFSASDFNALPLADQKVPGKTPDTLVGVAYDNTSVPGHTASKTFSGYARFMSLASPSVSPTENYVAGAGWVSLRGPSVAPAPQFFGCRNCSGTTCTSCQDSQNHLCTTLTGCTLYCEGAVTTTTCTTDQQCAGTGPAGSNVPCRPRGFCSTSPATSCKNDSDCPGTAGYCVSGAECSAVDAANGGACYEYGVSYDGDNHTFAGLAWSKEFGWLDFRFLRQSPSRFFQTRLGDIYSKGNVGSAQTPQSPPGAENCNSTYLITAEGSVNNFCSALSSDSEAFNAGFIPVTSFSPAQPSPFGANQYTTSLGRFDLNGIVTDVGGGKNKYGSSIVTLTLGGTDVAAPLRTAIKVGSKYVLGGRVIVANCPGTPPNNTCTFDSNTTINNGLLNPIVTGAGILVINGNLTINNPLTYQTSFISDLRQLGSLSVVVRGDLTMDNTVQEIDGAYIVPGQTYGTCDTVTTHACTDTSHGVISCTAASDCQLGGKIRTASSPNGANNHFPLVVKGLMIGREFEFGRKFAGTAETPLPSEQIIYDGRLQSNPMPGMIDFTKTLPDSLSTSP